MKDLLEFILTNITDKSNFTIKETNEDGKINFQVNANPESVGLIIGKGGRTIRLYKTSSESRLVSKKYLFLSR